MSITVVAQYLFTLSTQDLIPGKTTTVPLQINDNHQAWLHPTLHSLGNSQLHDSHSGLWLFERPSDQVMFVSTLNRNPAKMVSCNKNSRLSATLLSK